MLNDEYVKRFEPERFVPAAMGLLMTHSYQGLRNIMCDFIDFGDYTTLTPAEQLIFKRVWIVIDAELKDGKKLLDSFIQTRLDPAAARQKQDFTKFKTELIALENP